MQLSFQSIKIGWIKPVSWVKCAAVRFVNSMMRYTNTKNRTEVNPLLIRLGRHTALGDVRNRGRVQKIVTVIDRLITP
ncbi:MAG: hypothetical protein B7X48_13640 [Acidiphilium sp. 34-60-192]|nr:MAG: hypothetical protein B7X48_13640 [Acidiphilium sp. 34-60-192]